MAFISEPEIVSLLSLSEDDLLWLVQGLISGTLWLLGEFADDDGIYEDETGEGEEEEEDSQRPWELLAY